MESAREPTGRGEGPAGMLPGPVGVAPSRRTAPGVILSGPVAGLVGTFGPMTEDRRRSIVEGRRTGRLLPEADELLRGILPVR